LGQLPVLADRDFDFFFGLEIARPWRQDQARFRQEFWLDAFYMFFNFFLFPLIIYKAASELVVHWFQGMPVGLGLRIWWPSKSVLGRLGHNDSHSSSFETLFTGMSTADCIELNGYWNFTRCITW
jgi:hypothetical protein